MNPEPAPNSPPRKPPAPQSKDPTIPRIFLRSTSLSAGHKLVLAELISRQGSANSFRASFASISLETGISRRQVIRIINDLAERKEVTRSPVTFEMSSYSVRFANNRNRRRRIYLASISENLV